MWFFGLPLLRPHSDKTRLDRPGHAHIDQLHVLERFHRLDQNNLELYITMEDPKALAKPWDAHIGVSPHADWNILEQACTGNAAFVDFEQQPNPLFILESDAKRQNPEGGLALTAAGAIRDTPRWR
jgi:hypothetical protein